MNNTAVPDVRDWLSTTQAARVLGLSPLRVVQLADAGALRTERTALGRLYDPASVEALRAEREAKG